MGELCTDSRSKLPPYTTHQSCHSRARSISSATPSSSHFVWRNRKLNFNINSRILIAKYVTFVYTSQDLTTSFLICITFNCSRFWKLVFFFDAKKLNAHIPKRALCCSRAAAAAKKVLSWIYLYFKYIIFGCVCHLDHLIWFHRTFAKWLPCIYSTPFRSIYHKNRIKCACVCWTLTMLPILNTIV